VLGLLLLLLLQELVQVGNDTTTGDGGLDDAVELIITADGEEQMPWGDAVVSGVLLLALTTLTSLLALLLVHLTAGVARELEDLGGEVLEEGGAVDGGGTSTTLLAEKTILHATVDAANREVEASEGGAVGGLLLWATLATGLTLALTLSFASLTLAALAAALALGADTLAVLSSRDNGSLLSVSSLDTGTNSLVFTASDRGHIFYF